MEIENEYDTDEKLYENLHLPLMDRVFCRAIVYRPARQESHYSGDGGVGAQVGIVNI